MPSQPLQLGPLGSNEQPGFRVALLFCLENAVLSRRRLQ
jgi:hypothetical protein